MRIFGGSPIYFCCFIMPQYYIFPFLFSPLYDRQMKFWNGCINEVNCKNAFMSLCSLISEYAFKRIQFHYADKIT